MSTPFQECIDMNMTHQDYLCFCMRRRTKEGVTMCKVISRIRGKSANDLLRMSDQASCFPIDLEKLLRALSISCEPLDFEKIGGDAKILGALATNGDKAVIFYRQQDAKNSHRCRFTIAHEIAHACLSEKSVAVHFRMEGDVIDKEEQAANIFAGELLVPEGMLNVVIGKLIKPTIKSLSNVFDVSENVIRKRLEYLKIAVDLDDVILGNC